MRTKTLAIAAAALAAGVISSQAQTSNVYSANIVGYVNYTFASGFNTLASVFDAKPDNHFSNFFTNSVIPDNTTILIWDPTIQDFATDTPQYVAASGVWVPDAILNPGQSCFVLNFADPFTNTFVGEVKMGNVTNVIYPGFNAIASTVPIGGLTGTVLTNLPASDNDTILRFDPVTQDFFTDTPQYVAASGAWIPDATWNVGEGMYYLSFQTTPTTNWVRSFNAQ